MLDPFVLKRCVIEFSHILNIWNFDSLFCDKLFIIIFSQSKFNNTINFFKIYKLSLLPNKNTLKM